jgi:Ca2+-binding EF-hand superfamily protein
MKQTLFPHKRGEERMSNKDHFLGEKSDVGFHTIYSDLTAQMFAPFYALTNFFLAPATRQTDVVRLESKSKNETQRLALNPLKISPKVYSFLEQKAQAHELEDYITNLVEQDLDKLKKEETLTLIDSLREEFLGKINSLKQEIASGTVADSTGTGSLQANELRDFITKLGEQKLDKDQFQTLLKSFRSELLSEINQLKNEITFRPVDPAYSNNTKHAVEHSKEVDDLKEGQLLESDQVTGTIEEIIDVDF